MDPERLIGSLIMGALGVRGKRSGRTLRYLTGGGGSLINAGTLLGAAGLAWGVYETATRDANAAPAAAPGPARPSPPPLPGAAAAAGLSPDVLRVVRLTISAARADGTLAPGEREQILRHAREAGAEAAVEQELAAPRPLGEIVAGVQDPQHREALYALAFSLVRADDGVSGAERIYLAQLAHALGLDAAAAARLEAGTAARIQEQPEA